MTKNATSGETITKTYYLSKIFSTDWMGAFNFCKDNNMELVRFIDEAETNNFLKLCETNAKEFKSKLGTHIGAVTTSLTLKTEWYSFETGQKMDWKLLWGVNQPMSTNLNEYCMIAVPNTKGAYQLKSIVCYSFNAWFTCQDVVVA